MLKYPRTTSSTSSGYYDEDEPMNPYQTPPLSPQNSVPQYLQRHIVRMFSTEDASGTSAVAIDNKIEQAMDLVKSHLMIAVREEVEVLKERISELMDKINKLELENTVLKANMSQETLQQLQLQLQIANSNAPAAVAAPPVTPAIQAAPQQPPSTTNSNSGTVVENNIIGGDVVTAAVGGLTTNGTTVAATASPVTVAGAAAAAATVPAAATVTGSVPSTVTAAAAGDAVNTTNGPMSS